VYHEDTFRRRGGYMSLRAARRNFYLSQLQLKRLNVISKKLGLSASEILRRAIDEYWERFERKAKK
jgi:predicted DNA-binding protein